jgi:predicted phosphodiesterase
MKLLLFSDLHTDVSAATRLVELARAADAVVGAGDFANARPVSSLRPYSCKRGAARHNWDYAN